MVDQDVKREVDALRAELEALTRRLDGAGPAEVDSAGGGKGRKVRGGSAISADLLDQVDPKELSKHLAKFLESLGRDVRDSRPKALVAAFLAGFLAGRTLGR